MEKALIEIFNLLPIVVMAGFPFLKTKGRGLLTLGLIVAQVIISAIVAFSVFSNGLIEYYYAGSWVTGNIPVRIDYLSAWFMLIISFTFFTGAWYGIRYMKRYVEQTDNLGLHAIALIMVYTALIDICIVQNGIVMLVVWEIMALGSFIIIIFEHYKKETLKAGINFLIQSHIGVLFLTIAFVWVHAKTGSFDFTAISTYTASLPHIKSIGVFVLFFFGFAIKAGFVPFHTWLPLAHPAAPAHISGIMSGVIIKIGIYGILRVLLLIRTDMAIVGYFILSISVITGVYGVMLAIVQHNLKKLLAYHSIENIGIIGIGIGLGCLGISYKTPIMIIAGFGGALLHTLNHSLFKSLLFFGAGNVYLQKHTMNIESFGGIIKQLPHTAYLFLIGSMAICGLPPFNGFISEFFIYYGLFDGLLSSPFKSLLFILVSILSLVLIGGLAMICFTKAFGIVFLGTPREKTQANLSVEDPYSLIPLYIITFLIILIGIVPQLFSFSLLKTVQLYPLPVDQTNSIQFKSLLDNLTLIGQYSLVFMVLIAVIYFIRDLSVFNRVMQNDSTWGCGYTGKSDKLQYTASSFIRTYRKLAEPLLLITKRKINADRIYPGHIDQKTHALDKIECWLIDKPLYFIRKLLNQFVFLQNGSVRSYILYGFVFLATAVILPAVINLVIELIKSLN